MNWLLLFTYSRHDLKKFIAYTTDVLSRENWQPEMREYRREGLELARRLMD